MTQAPMTQAPKFNMALNPCYQVDCSFAASGKKVAQTKRRLQFRFGFSNAEALAGGLTGTACRGEEHEVTLIWSLTSGKRLVTADGQEVHVSRGGRAETKFETSWTMAGGHTLKLIAHAAPPLRYVPGFRQFDLFLDGCSYFDMPKIFELGVKNPLGRGQMVPTHQDRSFADSPAYNNYNVPDYEREHYDYAQERRRDYGHAPKVTSSVVSPTSVAQPIQREQQPKPQEQPQDLMSGPIAGVQDLIAAPVVTRAPPATARDEFTPVAPVVQPRSTAVVHNEILSAYGPPPATSGLLALTNGEVQQPEAFVPVTPQYNTAPRQYYATPVPHYQNQAPPRQYGATPPQYSQAPPPPQYTTPASAQTVALVQSAVVTPPLSANQTLTMNKLLEAPLEEESVDEIERALKNLVNIDDITTHTTAPEQKKIEKQREEKSQKHVSKPKPATAPSWHLGVQPALADIKASAPERTAPTQEVMRSHAFDPAVAQAGMMVLYGAESIPAASGFGVPTQMYHQQQYMYAQQQQQRYMYPQQQQPQRQQPPQVYTAY